MNPNHHNSWSNYIQNSVNSSHIPNLQNSGNSSHISNQQNSYFGNAPFNPNPTFNPNFQNSPFIPNLQINPHFGNYPYQLTNPTMLHGIQMSSSGMQSIDQVPETPQFCTQGGLETINLGEEVGSTVVKTPKIRFQPKEDEVLIQSWLNSSKNAIIGIDQKGESFWKRIGEAYNKYRDKKYIERKPMVSLLIEICTTNEDGFMSP
ncbi:unnamed protein product [Trifolium pratense]|uniref:Uncharacterized protein n=1 Tax=Trifolium pratense TaxID=57577 RepID=A0ACB0L712_TRIPR|nr:unnamed protein product [Trifolium pratense]